jgi:hypothetical protein
MTTLTVAPTDPETGSIFGTEALLFKFKEVPLDLTEMNAIPFPSTPDNPTFPIALAAATYRVRLIEFTPPAMQDDNVSANPATCIEGVELLNSSAAPGVPAKFTFNDPPSLTFTVRPGQTTLSLTVNVPGLIAAYESAFTCVPGNPPTLTAFDQTAFQNALLANVTLE